MRREFVLPEEPPVIIMIEEVPYPVERCWTARFEPLYLGQWWKPVGYSNPIVELDLEVGGRWRIGQRDPEGNEVMFYGVFEQVEPLRRTVQTLIAELFPELVTRIATDFSAIPGGTRIVSTHDLQREEVRQGYLRLGALERMAETSQNYDGLLAQLTQR